MGGRVRFSTLRWGYIRDLAVFSPLLFIIVLEALSIEFRGGLPRKLLHMDDLVLMTEMEELLLEKLKNWKKG